MSALRAACYGRVSTDEQVDGTSLETQEIACHQKARQIGATVAASYRDEGVSGTLYQSREGIQLALRDIESGRANILIASKIDRIGRSAQVVLDIASRIDRAGGELLTCDGFTFGGNAIGRLMLTLLAAFAEFERNMIRERTMTGSRRNAEKGKQPSRGRRPYGYTLVTTEHILTGQFPAGTEGTYVVLDEEARVVKDLFSRYASGQSLNGLAEWLNRCGIPTPKGGEIWRPRSVMFILQNSAYMGRATYGLREGKRDEKRVTEQGMKRSYYQRVRPDGPVSFIPTPPIVSEHVWQSCQERLRESQSLFGGNPRRRALLSGFGRCPVCKRGLSARTQNGHTYYTCNRLGRDAHKPVHRYPAGKLEGDFVELLRKAARRRQMFRAAFKSHKIFTVQQKPTDDTEALRERMAELEKREAATARAQVDAISQGRATEVYHRLLAEIDKERKEIDNTLARATAQAIAQATIDPEAGAVTVERAVDELYKVLTADDVLSVTERREAIAGFIKEIEPREEGLKVVWRPMCGDNETMQFGVVM